MAGKLLKIIGLLCVMSASVCAYCVAQERKPTILIAPSDEWCAEHGYIHEIEENGQTIKTPDYLRALKESDDLRIALTIMESAFMERGIFTFSLGGALRSAEKRGKKKIIEPDIWIYVSWQVKKQGPSKKLALLLEGKEADSGSLIAMAKASHESGVGDVADMLEIAISGSMDKFINQIQTYFDDNLEEIMTKLNNKTINN